MPNPYKAEFTSRLLDPIARLLGEISFTDPGNQPGPGTGGVNSVTAGDASVTVAGTLPDPTVAVSPLGIIAGKIAAKAVTAAKLASGAASAGQVATADGAGGVSYANPAVIDVTAGDASVVVAGTEHTTIETADLATIAALHPASGSVALNGKKITGLANGAAAQDAAAFGQIPLALPPNGAAGGGLGGTFPNPSVVKVQGVAVSGTAPTAGQVLMAGDATHAAWATPSSGSSILDTAQYTGGTLSVTATTDATAQTVCTGAGVALSGSETVLVLFYAPALDTPAVSAANIVLVLYDGSTDLGRIAVFRAATAATYRQPISASSGLLTPTVGTHTYSIRAFVTAGTGAVFGGAGTAGVNMAATMVVQRVT